MKNKRWNPRRLAANLTGTLILAVLPFSLICLITELAKGAYNLICA